MSRFETPTFIFPYVHSLQSGIRPLSQAPQPEYTIREPFFDVVEASWREQNGWMNKRPSQWPDITLYLIYTALDCLI